ncbi:hypothetical protein F4778DRAFT_654500 [Xylariomycetidae sp. FL2044]|nr:hypothetical protein F4778DRAFT_654500 [Xylariomycetidae sp. FL2044]
MEPPSKRMRVGQASYENEEDEENQDELSMTPTQFNARQDPLYQLDKGRAKAATRLKSTFEDIFAKYEKDFTDVGDEIDLETGEVIVDNGHLESLRDDDGRTEDSSMSSDEEERILRGKEIMPVKKSPSTSLIRRRDSATHNRSQSSWSPHMQGAQCQISPFMYPPGPFDIANPFSFGPSLFGNNSIDPTWQTPEMHFSPAFNTAAMGLHHAFQRGHPSWPGVAGSPNNSFTNPFGHQALPKRTTAKALTPKQLPATASTGNHDHDDFDEGEDAILLSKKNRGDDQATIAKGTTKSSTLAAFAESSHSSSSLSQEAEGSQPAPTTEVTLEKRCVGRKPKKSRTADVICISPAPLQEKGGENSTTAQQHGNKVDQGKTAEINGTGKQQRRRGRPRKSSTAGPQAVKGENKANGLLKDAVNINQTAASLKWKASDDREEGHAEDSHLTYQPVDDQRRRSSRSRKPTKFYSKISWLKRGGKPRDTMEDDNIPQTGSSPGVQAEANNGFAAEVWSDDAVPDESKHGAEESRGGITDSMDPPIDASDQDMLEQYVNFDGDEDLQAVVAPIVETVLQEFELAEDAAPESTEVDRETETSKPTLGGDITISSSPQTKPQEIFSRNEVDPSYTFSDDEAGLAPVKRRRRKGESAMAETSSNDLSNIGDTEPVIDHEVSDGDAAQASKVTALMLPVDTEVTTLPDVNLDAAEAPTTLGPPAAPDQAPGRSFNRDEEGDSVIAQSHVRQNENVTDVKLSSGQSRSVEAGRSAAVPNLEPEPGSRDLAQQSDTDSTHQKIPHQQIFDHPVEDTTILSKRTTEGQDPEEDAIETGPSAEDIPQAIQSEQRPDSADAPGQEIYQQVDSPPEPLNSKAQNALNISGLVLRPPKPLLGGEIRDQGDTSTPLVPAPPFSSQEPQVQPTTSSPTKPPPSTPNRTKPRPIPKPKESSTLTSSAKKFALASLIPDDPQDDDEISILTTATTSPSFRTNLAHANRHSPLTSPLKTTRRHSLLFNSSRTPNNNDNGSATSGTTGRTSNLSSKTRRLGSRYRSSGPASSPLARAVTNNLLLSTPKANRAGNKRKRAESPTPLESPVRTPGGTIRRCGVDGFVCERDFCLTCCK